MAPRGTVPPLDHPETSEIDLLRVLHALSDPTRMQIVSALLHTAGERSCGTFPVPLAPSTLSHHFKVLRQAGVARQRVEGRQRFTVLRTDDLEERFPGLIDLLVTLYGSEA